MKANSTINRLQDRIERQSKYIEALEERLRDAGALASRTIKLEMELQLARAAVASLKHKLFLIGSEKDIEDAITEHSVGLFAKTTLPTIGVKKRKARAHR